MERKNIRVKKHQFRLLSQEMENNPSLNANKLTGKYTALDRARDWNVLAEKLNAAGGAIKNVKAWQKCWSDHKSSVKARNLALLKERRKTGGGECAEKELSPEEERVLALIGQDAIHGLPVPESQSLPQMGTMSSLKKSHSLSRHSVDSVKQHSSSRHSEDSVKHQPNTRSTTPKSSASTYSA
ncbi:uncharacterized protein LOC129218774 [Uloborus diversus]|uniref:uncharacterized protein LOC129218774 n=1 Tax=Uloborus diversus TaxID=327109 RepID=UPI002408FB9A|nr:uncharacterized protein LOC129218774 [Uloborus diversus]